MSAATRLARTHSVSLVGLEGRLVRVETQVGRGLVQFVIVGLPDASVRESKDRVRSALESCGLEVLDSRVTVNLSPAGLHKSGSGFDLAIAASVLLAAGRVGPTSFDGAVIIGELALDGSLQPVRGVLPAVLAARGQGITRAIVPAANAAEASLVGGVETAAFAHLAELVRWAGGNAQTPVSIGGALPDAPEPEPATSGPHVDMADVRGQHDAVEALTVAGAGGHHVFLLGEPGSGKTMLASRMHTILPDLDDDTALVATSLHSLAGTLRDGEALVRRPPILTPHHSATMAALVGGGHARITPGAASLAHGGVLFLDEAAQFQPSVLDALREPLENGEVHIHRAGLHARLPARFQLLLAANPCPCGGGRQGRSCTCSAQARMRYLARLSGPLLDRIDITVRVDTPTRADLARGPSPSSARLRERVAEARSRCARRLAGTPWTLNAQVPGRWIRASSGIDPRMVADLDRAVESGVFSMRGADRVLRLMWTTADLNGAARPGEVERGLAIWLRKGDNPND
ncbi:YifB family Mg chelatase-like AAA ATPase [Schaalia sp. HMT-877]|nr:Mg chelatase-like protein [Actinomyces sp. oral taxon 877 str. F0543]WLD81089.1 YifB family Mg chelatase-like AAA ATPase [Schaalia sp. HMT-877]